MLEFLKDRFPPIGKTYMKKILLPDIITNEIVTWHLSWLIKYIEMKWTPDS